MKSALGFLFALALASSADAALIITVGSTDVPPGTTGSVDVFVRSTTGTDPLAIANLQFQITQIGGPAGTPTLSFTDPQSASHLSDAGYFFNGDSANQLLGPPASSISPTGDTYFGGDGTQSGLGILVPTTNTLLARLDLTAGPGGAGAVYRISLDGTNSSFLDRDFNPIDFSSVSGTVTTPEPATLAVFGAIAAVGLAVRRRRAGRQGDLPAPTV